MTSDMPERAEALVEALEAFITETVDYMTRNQLGDPEQQHNVKLARAALREFEGEKE